MRVLLVDDAEGMRKIITSMLKTMGYDDVITAGDGKEALQRLQAADVGLLLTNWSMPVMDGLELVRAVRAEPRYASLPIVMFTSRASRSDVVRALKVGVDGYVAKPFAPVQLREQIHHVLQRQIRQRIQHVTQSLDRLRPEDEYPVILVGEPAVLPGQLARSENQDALLFLDRVVTAVERLNSGADAPLIGVAASDDSHGIARLMQRIGARTKALIVNVKMAGGLTVARLTSVNNRHDVKVFLTCERKAKIPEEVRSCLEKLHVTLLERDHLDIGSLQQLVTENALAASSSERPSELPSPEEINKRLRMDILTVVALPVMPNVFRDIAELARDPDSDIQKWIHAIEADPLSSAQVVRRARSPAYGFRGEVQEAGRAIVLLGKNTVKELVVSEAVQRAFQGVQEDQFDIADFWLHSVSVALTARLFVLPLEKSQRTSEQNLDFEQYELSDLALAALGRMDLASKLTMSTDIDPFTGGMMHDIGKVVLVHSYPGLYPAVLNELVSSDWNIPMRVGEETIAGGADHTAVGKILAESWRLGDGITRVIEHHHNPSADDDLTCLVALADVVVGGIEPYPKDAPYPMVRLVGEADAAASEGAMEALAAFLPRNLCDRLGLSDEDLIELSRVLGPSVRKRAEELRQSL